MDGSGVLPDDERPHWMLDPFSAVGPLRFGMARDEASSVVDEINALRRKEQVLAAGTQGI
jgi:hypothetical protein